MNYHNFEFLLILYLFRNTMVLEKQIANRKIKIKGREDTPMKRNDRCHCYKCSWFITQKNYCVAQEKDTTSLTGCCKEYKNK